VLEEKVRRKLYSVLLLSARVRLLEPKSLERSTGKAKRVIDKRPKNGF
jgi:phenylacetate-CoA ligase